MSGNDAYHRLARAYLDRAFLALALGVATGTFTLVLPCRGRHLQRPVRRYAGDGWEAVAADPPPSAAVEAIAAGWPGGSRLAYLDAVVWWAQIPDRVRHTGVHGR